MTGLYVFATIVGWPFLLSFVFFGGEGDVDADIDGDVDLDNAADAGSAGIGAAVASILSFRSAVFFLAFFGLTGLVLGWLEAPAVLGLLLAVGAGVLAAYLNRLVFGWLRESGATTELSNAELAGSQARVVLPIGSGRRGRVALDIDGQRIYLVATPFNPKKEETFSVGDSVVVIEVDNGTARVAPMEALEA